MDRARAPQAPSPSVASFRPSPTDFRGPSALLPGDSSDSKSSSTLQSSIIAIFVVITSFIVLACYTLYKFYKNRQRRRRSSSNEEGLHQQERQEEDDEEEEDYGPVLDHPIWYIRTAGLQPSVISSITTVRYEKGDGLVEGTHCSVCLNEFQGGESLRLLPKCSHAFHMPCIDTWLSSHTNCPLCRAPIVLPALEETGIDHSDDDDDEDIRELGSDDDRDLETRGSDGVGFEVVIENVKEQEERLMVMEEEMKCN